MQSRSPRNNRPIIVRQFDRIIRFQRERVRHGCGSVPGNPLLAEPLYLTKYIERMGTGTGDMIERCRKAGLPEPEFKLTDGFGTTLRRKPERAFESVGGQVTVEVTGQVTGWIVVALRHCEAAARSSREIQEATGFRHRETFQRNYLDQLLNDELPERTIPEKPNSRLQKYRLTAKGAALLAAVRKP